MSTLSELIGGGGGGSEIVRVNRTSNTVLGVANLGNLINITSGTFTQTFDAAATLGSGWFCYIRNSGSGDITLNPNASETIDGLTSYAMYPGEERLVQCDGTDFVTVLLSGFLLVIDSTKTFTKPPGYSAFSGYLWGAGGSGGKRAQAGGGGGGACVPFSLHSSFLSASEVITIGAGGAGVTTTATDGINGGNSTFGSLFTAYGGAGGQGVQNLAGPGGPGGGWFEAGVTSTSISSAWGGGPLIDVDGVNGRATQIYGGGRGTQTYAPVFQTIYGGAGGAGGSSSFGNSSIYGGGGGGPGYNSSGGSSIFGGDGGAGSGSSSGSPGSVPGGGGGSTESGATTGAGGGGRCVIWGLI